MGMFDSISVYMPCPKCESYQSFEAQTKDLDCVLYEYIPLDEDWETKKFGRKFRVGLPVFPRFPLDKSSKVWKDQAEQSEAAASLKEPYASQLKFVSVFALCDKCKAGFNGKIKVQNGRLVGPVYDIHDEEEIIDKETEVK